MMVSGDGLVFVARRIDMPSEAWQSRYLINFGDYALNKPTKGEGGLELTK